MAFVLIGFMGAGKSTVAAELAAALGVTPLDSDALLEERMGHPIADAFARSESGADAQAPDGGAERSFRAQEEELVSELLEDAGPGKVIALGGGSVLSERVRRSLERHVTVLLDVDPAVAWERAGAPQPDAAARPLARDQEQFLALYEERRALYEELADALLPDLPLGSSPRTLGALRALSKAPPGTRLLWASAASGDYPVLIGRGLLAEGSAARLAQIWPLDRSASRPFCVTDETVSALYGGRLGELRGTIALAPGEANKTIAGAERVWRALLGAGVTRADHVVALGGGVVGDLAGFCAATYQRGIPVVQVPTTLLAQVDSAYGGKTGVDLPEAKNYVGAYHQPAGVLVDPATLDTLPPRELACGWVEVLKTALIAGGALWDHVARDGALDERTILACARTKLAVVAQDERDSGRRQVLNLGHTVGHAIETASNYASYNHGEAVGLGLLVALRLSGLQDLRAQVRELLLAHGLPVNLGELPVDAVLQATARDKKRLASRVPFVLVRAPGDVMVGCELADDEVRAAVTELAG